MGLGDLKITYNLSYFSKEIAKLWAEICALKNAAEAAENPCCVISVNGQAGVVELTTTHIPEGTNLYYTDSRVQAFSDPRYAFKNHTHPLADITDFPSQVGQTGKILFTNGTTPYWGTINISNYNDAYNNQIVSAAFTGTTTKTLTLTQQDGGTITASFTDLQGSGGVADGNNFPTALAFNDTNGILTLSRSGLSALTVDLDGRYIVESTFNETDPTVAAHIKAITVGNIASWNLAYQKRIVGFDLYSGAGTDTKTLRITLADGSFLDASFDDIFNDFSTEFEEFVFNYLSGVFTDTPTIDFTFAAGVATADVIVGDYDDLVEDIMVYDGTEIKKRTVESIGDSIITYIEDNDLLDTTIYNYLSSAFQDTPTIDISFNSGVITADAVLSIQPNNSLQILGDGLYNTQTIKSGVVAGGIVTWLTGYTYNVSAASYYINGVLYSSPSTDVTLSAADPTLDRTDIIAVDINGDVIVIEGTPSEFPAETLLDPEIQLRLSAAQVEAGTTEPSGVIQECIYQENVEWTAVSNSANIDIDSTFNPAAGTYDIEATAAGNGNNVTLTRASAFLPLGIGHNTLRIYIRSKSFWGNAQRKLAITFKNGGTTVGTTVNLYHGVYGFDSSNVSAYQAISIPLSDFGLNVLSTIDNIVFQVVSNGGNTINFHLDNICLMGGSLSNVGSAYVFQNGITHDPLGSIVEFGGTLLHDTTLYTNYYKQFFTGITVYEYPYQFQQGQYFSSGTGIVSFKHEGQAGDLEAVRLGINYTGDDYGSGLTGYMNDKKGYFISTNVTGNGSFGLRVDDTTAKYAGMFLHTTDNAYDDVITFFGNHISGTTYVSSIATPGGTLENDRILTLHGTGDVTFWNYPNTRNDGITSVVFYPGPSGELLVGPVPTGDGGEAMAKTVTINQGAAMAVTGVTTQTLEDDPEWTIAHGDTSSVTDLDTTTAQVIDTMTFDTFGHVTGVTTRNLTLTDLGYSEPSIAHTHIVGNSAGVSQFTFGIGETIRFAASGAASVGFDSGTKTITFTATAGEGADGNDFVDDASFNTSTGEITLTRTGVLSDIVFDIDGRYLTSFTETDPIAIAKTVTLTQSTGITVTGTAGQALGDNPSWTIAHADTSSYAGLDTSAAQVIDTLTVDTFGHVTAITTRNLTLSDLGYVADGNDYVDGASFNTSTGVLTLTRTGVLADITVDLDDRYVITETDPIANAKTITLTQGAGITITGTAGQTLTTNPTWTVAHADTSTISNVDTTGAEVIDTITFDTYGHITAVALRSLTAADIGAITTRDRFGFTGEDVTAGENRTFALGSLYTLLLTGSTQTNVFRVTSTTGGAIKGEATTGTAVAGTSSGSSAFAGSFSASGSGGTGVFGQANNTNGIGIWGSSTSGLGGQFNVNPASTNTLVEAVRLYRNSSGTAANGIGTYLGYHLQTTDSTTSDAGRLGVKWVNATTASRSAAFEMYLTNAGTSELKLSVLNTGAIQGSEYGGGLFTGTPTFYIAVDSSGNFIEVAAPEPGEGADGNDYVDGVSFNTSDGILTLTRTGVLADLTADLDGRYLTEITANNGLTASTSSNVQLGGTLLANTTINADAYVLTVSRNAGTPFQALSTSGFASIFQITPTSTNTAPSILQLTRLTSGTAANGIGGAIQFDVEAVDGAQYTANTLVSKWTDVTVATRTSMFEIFGVNSGTTARKLAISGAGKITGDTYGGGLHTGTATFYIATDASGNFIEVAAPEPGEGADGNDYVDGASFNTANGEITLTRTGALADIVFDLDGRYSLLGHTHVIADITDYVAYTNEMAQDTIAAMFAAGVHTGITFTYDDGLNRMDVTAISPLTATYVGFGSTGTNQVTGSANFTYNSTDGYLSLTGTNGEPRYQLRSGTNGSAMLEFNESGTINWLLGKIGSTKNLIFNRYNTSGVFQATDLAFEHSTGNLLVNSLKTGSSAPTTSGSTKMVISDTAGRLSFADIPSSGTTYTDEMAQDAIAAMIAAGTHSGIDITYDDALNTLSFDVTAVGIPTVPIELTVGGGGGAPANDTNTYTNAGLIGKTIRVYREGERLFEGDTTYGHAFNDTTGVVTFYPNLATGENLIIEVIDAESTLVGGGEITTNNTLYVSKNGNDTTGERNQLDKPYLTILAAATDASAGDTIVVYPGDYEEADSLPTNTGLTYEFLGEGELTMNSSITTDGIFSNNGLTGNAKIYAPGWTFTATTAQSVLQHTLGDVEFTFNRAISTSRNTIRLFSSGTATAKIRGNYAESSTDACIFTNSTTTIDIDIDEVFVGDTNAFNVVGSSGNIKSKKVHRTHVSSTEYLVYLSADTGSKLFVEIDYIYAQAGWAYYTIGNFGDIYLKAQHIQSGGSCTVVSATQSGGTSTVEANVIANHRSTATYGLVHAELGGHLRVIDAKLVRIGGVSGYNVKTSGTSPAPSLELVGVAYDPSLTTESVAGSITRIDKHFPSGITAVLTESAAAKAVRYDTTTQAFTYTDAPIAPATRTSDAAIANTETVVISKSMAANTLTAGMMIRVKAFCTQAGTNAATPTVRLRIGTTTLTGTAITTLTGAVGTAANPSVFEAWVTIRSVGASGTAIGGISQIKSAVATAITQATATSVVDTTATNLVELTFISGNGSNTYTFQNASLEVIKP